MNLISRIAILYLKCSVFNKNYETYKETVEYGSYTERKKAVDEAVPQERPDAELIRQKMFPYNIFYLCKISSDVPSFLPDFNFFAQSS